ncbi:hypothetical protein D9M71_503350 [compost metagenome]
MGGRLQKRSPALKPLACKSSVKAASASASTAPLCARQWRRWALLKNAGRMTIGRAANSAARSQNSASGPFSSARAKVPGGCACNQAWRCSTSSSNWR